MRQINQWINWQEVQRPGEPKPAKVPCVPVNAPERWAPYDVAAAIDPVHVGFVLTDRDPYFCIDLDHAWDGANWSPQALDTLARFAGAYVEVSYSGDGLHIIGRGAPPDGYTTRGPGVEFYTQGRFIAITWRHAQGDPDTDCTAALAAWCPLYLRPASMPGEVQGWTDGPCEGATPIADDDALIAKMLGARPSAGVAFGGKASAADLWNADAQALADAWPSPTDAWDRSAADAALAAHLAFWTGKDCERIARLMRCSALVREKWDRRGDDYLARTITGACGRVNKVYTVQPVGGALPGAERAPGWNYLTVEQQHEHFAGCVYVVGLHRVLMPNGELLKPEQFNGKMGGHDFEIAYGGRPEKKAFNAFTESRLTRFPKADKMCFRPEATPGAIINEDGLTLVNTYVPAQVPLSFGDVTLFLDHLGHMLPDKRDQTILISYLAALRQYPGVKFRWCPLVQGVQGNGKSSIMNTAEYICGKRYTHKPSAANLSDSGLRFNGWMAQKLLVLIEEVYVTDRRELLDALKPLITDDRVEFQPKGVDQVTAENRANFILTSNHKDAILKTDDDRRYAIFYTAQQAYGDLARDGLTESYFTTFWQWMNSGGYANVAGYLQRYAIPDALNPATYCNRAPHTSSTDAAIQESRGVVEQEIIAAVEEGRPGFCGGWISSVRLTQLLTELRRNVAPRKRRALMESIGYVPHPALPNGQVNTPIMQEEMKRPVLYVRRDSIPALNITEGGEAVYNYMNAQGYGAIKLHSVP